MSSPSDSRAESLSDSPAASRSLTRFAWLSIAAASTTISLKAGAFLLTGSVGLLSDALESVGNLVAAIAAVGLTGWQGLDPLVALAVGVNIVRSGTDLVRRSVLGLLDTAIPAAERVRVEGVLEHYRQRGIEWHALRTRQAGARRFVELH